MMEAPAIRTDRRDRTTSTALEAARLARALILDLRLDALMVLRQAKCRGIRNAAETQTMAHTSAVHPTDSA